MQDHPDVNKVWKEELWTEEARNIIKFLENSEFEPKCILILRHSQRFEPSFDDNHQFMELTPQGRFIARLFGTKLPKNRIIRLFHSPVNRCKETADQIHAGFKSIGGESIFKGECSAVWGIGIKNDLFMAELKKMSVIEVFFRWASGFYKQKDFPSIISYSQKAADAILTQFTEAPERGIDIYITHDWHLTAIRYVWFGLPPIEKLVGFLGGFAFRFEEEYFVLLDYGEIKRLKPPYWWKNK
ncbi:MAG: histidine phosphatase family protein [Candidatus Thorarchaeota archaeon]